MKKINEALGARALVDYNRNYSNIDQADFEKMCFMDPKSVINGDEIVNIGFLCKQLLVPNYLKGERDFLDHPEDVKAALEKYFPNMKDYLKPAQFASVADFMHYMENPEAADVQAQEIVDEDSITKIYNKYYTTIPRDVFDRLIAMDPHTTDNNIGEVAKNLLLTKYQTGDRTAINSNPDDVKDIIEIYYKDSGTYPEEAKRLTSYDSYKVFSDYIKVGPDSDFITALKNDDWQFNLPEHRYHGRPDERTHHTIDQDIEFIGATSEYNILSPKSQLANFAIGGGYQVNNGMHWCTSMQVQSDRRQYFNYWDTYRDNGHRVYINIMKKGAERGTTNRPYNWQFNMNVQSGDIQYFLDGNDNASLGGGNAGFKTFLMRHPDIIPVIKDHPFFAHCRAIEEANDLIKLGKRPLLIDSRATLNKILTCEDNTYIDVVREVTIENLEKIPNGAFADFYLLEKVHFGDSVKVIGAEAFKGTAISKLELPKFVESIEEEAFANCQLKGAIRVPDTLVNIGYRAFAGNSGYRLKVNFNRTSKLKVNPADRKWASTYIEAIDARD